MAKRIGGAPSCRGFEGTGVRRAGKRDPAKKANLLEAILIRSEKETPF